MIYVDLDETLVLSVPYWWMPDERPLGAEELFIGDDTYFVALRPLIKDLLKCCRELDETRVLTMGTHAYAVEVCQHFDLGFSSEQIVGRDDYLFERNIWGGTDLALSKIGVDPTAILIDNQQPTEIYAQAKMKYLGIKAERYINIRTFTGKDPDCFAAELNKIQCRLQELKS